MRSVSSDSSSLAKAGIENRLRDGLCHLVDVTLREAFIEAAKVHTPILFVKEYQLVDGPPLAILDTEIEDVHFFADGDSMLLGVGSAREWVPRFGESFERIRLDLDSILVRHSLCSVSLLGGWSFGNGAKEGKGKNRKKIMDETWKDFPESRWVIPALCFASANGVNSVNIAVYVGPSDSQQALLKAYYEQLVDRICTVVTKPLGMPSVLTLESVPSRKQWVALARRAIKTISEGGLEKVVLARALRVEFARTLEPSVVLERLVKMNPDSRVFAIKSGKAVFLGATPEGLVSFRDGLAKVDCLASTAPRSADAVVDGDLGRTLLADKKSRHEHQLVVNGVVRSLSTLIAGKIEVTSKTRVKKLATVQHLQTVVCARLGPNADIFSIAFALWPTPATGGEPKELASQWIREFEPIKRGWYSGVVGCVNPTHANGDLAVAIRSGVMQGNQIVLFAGAGIVLESSPEQEFEETSWKMQTMFRRARCERP